HGVNRVDDFVRRASDVWGENEALAATSVLCSLDRRRCSPGTLADQCVIEVGIEVLVFFHEEKERTARCLLDQRTNLSWNDPGRRLQDGAERRLGRAKAGQLPDPLRAVSRAGERAQHFLWDLQSEQPTVLVFVYIEEDRPGDRVQDVAGGQMPI